MPFGATRLGYRSLFKKPIGLPDRSGNTNKVLVFYGTPTAYRNNPPNTYVWPNIRDREILLSNDPTLIIGYENLPADLREYSHIWDIGYNSIYNTAHNPSAKLLYYLQSGGGLFLLGENIGFLPRDDAITTFIKAAGGGNIAVSRTLSVSLYTTTVNSEFLIANNSTSVTLNAPNGFTSVGTGTPITSPIIGTYPAVCWKTGSLSNALNGSITSVLDVNFMDTTGNTNFPFVDNIIATLNKK